MQLNCDLGEDFGMWKIPIDNELYSLIDQANIACGFHAGDPLSIENTLRKSIANNLEIGAHPSYPDRQGFGRRHMRMEPDELTACLRYQIAALRALAVLHGGKLSYVKPHGALYNDLVRDEHVRHAVFNAVAGFKDLCLMVQAHPLNPTFISEASEIGLPLQFEAFIDRLYLDDGTLAPRSLSGSVLEPEAAIKQARQLITNGKVTTHSGQTLAVNATTLCLHGDNPNALHIAKQIRSVIAE